MTETETSTYKLRLQALRERQYQFKKALLADYVALLAEILEDVSSVPNMVLAGIIKGEIPEQF